MNEKILLCASLNIPFELNIQNIFFFFQKKSFRIVKSQFLIILI